MRAQTLNKEEGVLVRWVAVAEGGCGVEKKKKWVCLVFAGVNEPRVIHPATFLEV